MKKNKVDWKKIFHWKNILIVAICLIAEILFSNYQTISVLLSGEEEYSININDAVIIDEKNLVTIDNGKIIIPNGTDSFELYFNNIDAEMRNIHFTIKSDDEYYANVIMKLTDDNFANYTYYFDQMETHFTLSLGRESEHYNLYRSCGKVQTLKLNFDNMESGAEISAVTFNTPPMFSFNYIRIFVILCFCFIIKSGVWKIEPQDNSYGFLVRITAYVCVFLILLTGVMAFIPGSRLFYNYPLDLEGTQDIYAQLLNAFHNQRLDLDISIVKDFDVEIMEKLDNPYDYTERIMKGANITYTWDRAYYNGKFYSYFGFTPVITVMYPLFLITKKIPNTLLTTYILTIFTIMSFSALYILLLKKFFGKIPSLLALLGQYAFIFGSLLFAFMSEYEFYYVATLSGLWCVTSFLYFILKAYFEEDSFKKRILFLILSGIFVVLTVESRPTLLFYEFIAIIPAVLILRNKDENIKNKIIYICSIGTPVLIGAVIIMIYNYLRFDTPFEFGLNYQITVCNPRANVITLSVIPTALYYYYLPHLKFHSTFPYIDMPKPKFEIDYHRYVYLDRVTGILTFPLTWFSFFISAMNKKDKFKWSFYVSLLLISVFLSMMNTFVGGINYRYAGDFLFAFNLVALAVIFEIITMAKKAPVRIYSLLYAIITIAMILTIVLGILLAF